MQVFDNLVLNVLSFLKILNFSETIDETLFHNRSLIFWHEAKKRNLKLAALKFLGRTIQEFRLDYEGRKYYFEGTPLNIFPSPKFLDNKIKVKKFLQKKGIPVASGELFTDCKKALEFAKKIGLPVVIKPNTGSLSHHVICPVDSFPALSKAFKIVKSYRPDFIVEKYTAGNLYRISVIGKKYVFVCKKDRANILGNGYANIDQLIQTKNGDINRGETRQLNTTLHKIPQDNVLLKNLKSQGLTLGSIPPKDKKIYLQDKYILSTGCDVVGCTGVINPANKKLFLKIAGLFNTDILGIDFICQDIRRNYLSQTSVVLETNSLPYIDMHMFPSEGKPDDVAKISWDFILGKLDKQKNKKFCTINKYRKIDA